MDFAEPKLLTLAAVLMPLTGLFLWWAWRRKQAALNLFVRARLLADLTVGLSRRRQILKRWLLLLGIGCLLVSLARPRWGVGDEVAQASGRDIIVCVDVSRSMMATDVAPSRLARAKLACYDLLSVAKTDRVGLIAFAGSAFLQCPLALDAEAFRQNVAALDTEIIPDQGTALGDALDEALDSFNADSGTSKAVILITDGEDHEDQALSAARRLAREGIRLFTVGVGTPNGELLKSTDPYGNSVFFKDEDGNPVKSKLNEELLRQISDVTRGFYLPLQTSRTMTSLYDQGIAPLASTKFNAATVRARIERFQWPLGLGVFFLLAELLIPEASKDSKRTTAPAGLRAAVVALAALVLLAPPLRASPDDAMKSYKRGEFDKAREEYERLAKEKPEDFRLRFNAGTSAYRQGDYKGAAGLFEQVLRSPDLGLQQQGWYNLGNARYQAGDAEPDSSKKREQWEQALASYGAALKLNPADNDAKANFDHVRRAIEMIPPPPEQQQQQQQNGDNKNQQPKNPKNQQQSKNDQKSDQGQQQQQQQQQQAGQQGQTNSPAGKEGQKQEQAGDPNSQQKEQQGQGEGEQAGAGQDGDKSKSGNNASGERVQVGEGGEDRRGEGGQNGDSEKDERKGTLMTVREAEKVLDAQKNAEKALIFRNRDGGENGASGPRGYRRKQW